MCCLHLQGVSGINWGKEKCQLCRIIAKILPGKRKGKGLQSQGHEGPEGVTCIALLSLTSALDVGEWLTPRPGRFTPGKDRVPIVYEAGWAIGSIWSGADYLAASGIRSSNRPGRSKSLHRLRYPCRFYPVLLHNGHIPFSQSFQKQH